MTHEQLPGWFNFEDIYTDAVRNAPHAGVLVEIGVAFGRSLAFLARQSIDQGRTDLKIYGVDHWTEHDYNACVEGMRRYTSAELDRVILVQSKSLEAAKVLPNDLAFAFIDADHSTEAVCDDLTAWYPKVAIGGVLAGHDIDWPTVRVAVDGFFGAGNYEVSKTSWRVTRHA